MRIPRLILGSIMAALSIAASQALLSSDPARNLARVRLLVTGTAATTDVTVAGATLASYTSTVLNAADGSGASQTGQTMRMSNGAPGQTAEARFDMILADLVPGRTITWNLKTSMSAETG